MKLKSRGKKRVSLSMDMGVPSIFFRKLIYSARPLLVLSLSFQLVHPLRFGRIQIHHVVHSRSTLYLSFAVTSMRAELQLNAAPPDSRPSDYFKVSGNSRQNTADDRLLLRAA